MFEQAPIGRAPVQIARMAAIAARAPGLSRPGSGKLKVYGPLRVGLGRSPGPVAVGDRSGLKDNPVSQEEDQDGKWRVSASGEDAESSQSVCATRELDASGGWIYAQ